MLSGEAANTSFNVFGSTRDRTHDLPHSRRPREQLHHQGALQDGIRHSLYNKNNIYIRIKRIHKIWLIFFSFYIYLVYPAFPANFFSDPTYFTLYNYTFLGLRTGTILSTFYLVKVFWLKKCVFHIFEIGALFQI